jgi:lipopolysaccharide transport protein LptA
MIKLNKLLLLPLCFMLGAQYTHAMVPSENIFGSKSNDDSGPVTVCSDSILYDQLQHQIVYEGNVIVMQIKGVTIQCQENGGAFPELISKTKPNYSLWVEGKAKDYPAMSKIELEKAKEICQKQGACRFINGQKLTITMDKKTNQVDKITMMVDDDKNRAQYYSLPDKKTDSQQQVVYAQGNVMQYLPLQNILNVSGHAKLDRGGNTFTGDEVTYNTKSERVNVPNTGGRATMIIDNDTLGE